MEMNLADIVNGPWAITPEMYMEIQAIYSRHLRGEKADLAAIEASLGRKLKNRTKRYEVKDGVAILPLVGVVAKRANIFMRISGGVSTEIFSRDYASAMDNPDVKALVIDMDTPGGTVDGTPDVAEQIFSSRGVKPVITWTNGMMASAGTWIGTAADRVYISSEVVTTGSIGVVAGHRDVSKREKKMGVKTTEITAGRYKRIASSYAPLSEDGRAVIQAQVDHIYSVFVDAVGRHRGMTPEAVLERAADGRIFAGKQGIEAGLVDGVLSFEEVLEKARIMGSGGSSNPRSYRAKGGNSMTPEKLEEEYPEAVGAIRAGTEQVVLSGLTAEAVENSVPAVAAGLREKGAQAERDRIADVRSQLIPGYEGLIAKMELDGKSTGADAARAIVAAERDSLSAAGDRQRDEANPVVDAADAPVDGGGMRMKRAEFDKRLVSEKKAFLADGGIVED